MGAAFAVVWGIALLIIAMLLVALLRTSRQQTEASDRVDLDKPVALATDTLLFYHERDGVQSTADRHVTVHIPGIAWDERWRDDLLRLEISELSPQHVSLPQDLAPVQALAVFDMDAYRMTEIGRDIAVFHFAGAIGIVLSSQGHEGDLAVAALTNGRWVLAPPSDIPPHVMGEASLPVGHRGVAVSLLRPGRVCLVRLAAGGLGAAQ
jgi:hypothetical protein